MKLPASIVALIVLGLIGCKDTTETTQLPPKVVAQISAIQLEHSLTDEELSTALKRWMEMYTGTKDLLESEDIFGGSAWTPERLAELLATSEDALQEMRHEDQALAGYSLSHLFKINEGKYEDAADSLRRIVARHYMLVKNHPNEAEEQFIKNLQKTSVTDPKLKALLENSEREEANTKPTR